MVFILLGRFKVRKNKIHINSLLYVFHCGEFMDWIRKKEIIPSFYWLFYSRRIIFTQTNKNSNESTDNFLLR